MDETTRKAVRRVAEQINKKRRDELLTLYRDDSTVSTYLKQIRAGGQFKAGSKKKGYRLIASLPLEVDRFFTKIYGRDYYKEPNFFDKYAKEWKVFEGN